MNRPVNRYFENRHLHTFGSELTNWNWQQHVNYSAPETDVLELDEQYLLEIALPQGHHGHALAVEELERIQCTGHQPQAR